jgi:hypothetical protein
MLAVVPAGTICATGISALKLSVGKAGVGVPAGPPITRHAIVAVDASRTSRSAVTSSIPFSKESSTAASIAEHDGRKNYDDNNRRDY